MNNIDDCYDRCVNIVSDLKRKKIILINYDYYKLHSCFYLRLLYEPGLYLYLCDVNYYRIWCSPKFKDAMYFIDRDSAMKMLQKIDLQFGIVFDIIEL